MAKHNIHCAFFCSKGRLKCLTPILRQNDQERLSLRPSSGILIYAVLPLRTTLCWIWSLPITPFGLPVKAVERSVLTHSPSCGTLFVGLKCHGAILVLTTPAISTLLGQLKTTVQPARLRQFIVLAPGMGFSITSSPMQLSYSGCFT
jgi:hypothetical protein